LDLKMRDLKMLGREQSQQDRAGARHNHGHID
jgi:hypothetical protein